MVDARTQIPPAARRRFLFPVLLLLLAATLTGCTALRDWWERNDTRYVLAFYQVPSSHEDAYARVTELPTFDGRTVRVVDAPVLTSANIARIEKTAAADGATGIRVTFDARGCRIWYSLCRSERQQDLVVALDQWQRAVIRITPADAEKTEVVIPGPWSAAEADSLVKFAESNYKLLQPNAN